MSNIFILVCSYLVLSDGVEGFILSQRSTEQWSASSPIEKYKSNLKFTKRKFQNPFDKFGTSFGLGYQTSTQRSRFPTRVEQNVRTRVRNEPVGFRRVDPKCKGLENLLSDIGVMSYVLGFIGTMIGFTTMLISFVTQIQTVLSTYVVGVPSSLVTLNTFFGDQALIPTALSNFISVMGLIDTFVNLTFATPVNGLVNVTNIFGAMFSFVSLYIGSASTFPDAMKLILEAFIGTDPEVYFANYGCPPNQS